MNINVGHKEAHTVYKRGENKYYVSKRTHPAAAAKGG